MVSIYFGLPGCGKTTAMTHIALKMRKHYEHIRCNVPLNLDFVEPLRVDWLGKYSIENTLLLIDEGTIAFDSRDFKNFGKEKTEFFMMHRHYECDVIVFVQRWDAVDLKIRSVTEQVVHVYRPFLFGKWITRCVRVPYQLVWPKDAKGKPCPGDLTMGYCKPSPIQKLTCPIIFRPRYYKLFDTHIRPKLPAIPQNQDVW